MNIKKLYSGKIYTYIEYDDKVAFTHDFLDYFDLKTGKIIPPLSEYILKYYTMEFSILQHIRKEYEALRDKPI